MVRKVKGIVAVAAVMLVLLLSGCASQPSVKDLSPEEVVTQFWMLIGKGDYEHAYDLAYHANQNLSKQAWIDKHVSMWGEKGSYIKIYSFNVTESYPINSSLFEGNFSEARIVNTNATISYMGQNETGELRIVVVNTTDGWKIFGNY
ncbi:hypothetical protein Mtc_1263 [Methanocella conradii HZ254]|uniref:DUF4878 domain-containing protein n=1 Tax=Methanocella conradii (strain DSM 24694 / JCM 17849 / CGMCC 1.5162 / HZ254) TaxID=1041930 RepID=H8I9H2_METCZ|nr:hypothetical protein [Methanocella conradii]AFD00017.1 hypothetical protein Mtc_1263 [Methanocella conradii HZ254]MDI6897363.1 hypothetical protein [Methanocella conradii]